jgi:hypothetical protein
MFTRTSKILLVVPLFFALLAWSADSIALEDFSRGLDAGFWQLKEKSNRAYLASAKDDDTSTPARAYTAASTAQWTFSIIPYLWLPNVNGALKYNIPPGAGGSPDVEVGQNNFLENLQALIMISGDARRERWSVFTDLIYLDFSDQNSTVQTINFGGNIVNSSVNIATNSSLWGIAWTLAAGYTVNIVDDVMLDVFGGFRYFEISASTDWQLAVLITGPGAGQTFPETGDVSEHMTFWDGVIGIRGRVPIGKNWSIPYYLDVGVGSSNLTWQGLLGGAYTFKWGGLTLAYRTLFYDQKDDKFLQDLRFSGPTLGVTFRF